MNMGYELFKNVDKIIKTGEHFGVYRGFVEDNNDPEKRMRHKVYVPGFYPEQHTLNDLHWAEFGVPFGGFSQYGEVDPLPIGATVFVHFLQGNADYPIVIGCWYGYPDDKPEVPSEIRDNYPNVKIIKSRSGAYILFDDKSGAEKIIIKDKNGDTIEYDTNSKRITIISVGDMDQTVGGVLTLDITKDINISGGAAFNVSVTGVANIKSDTELDLKSPIITLDGGTVEFKNQGASTVAPNPNGGPYNCLPFDPVTGIVHQGTIVTSPGAGG